MDSGERTRHSFVLVIWSEGPIGDGGSVVWRGTIADAVTNERCAFQSFDQLIDFLAPYLDAMGVEPEAKIGAREWVRRWSSRLAGSGKQPESKDKA